MGSDLAILSVKRKFREITVGVEDSLRNLSVTIYKYLAITMFVFITFYTLIERTAMNSKKKRRVLKCIKKNCWKSFLMLVNHENINPQTTSTTLIYLSFCIFIFCVINSFLALMSADLVKRIEPPIIDTVHDLLYHTDFRKMDIIIPVGAWQEQGFLTAVDGSDESEVWKRNGTRFKISVTDFNFLFSKMYSIIRDLARRKAVLVFDTFVMNIFISIGCQADATRIGQYFHISDEKFIPGNLMVAYNPKIKEPLRDYFDSSFQRIQESGWARHFFSELGYKINLDKIGEFELYKCIKGFRDSDKDLPAPFDIRFLATALFSAIFMKITALLVLIIEHFLFKTNAWLKLGMKKDKKQDVRKQHDPIY